MDFRLSKAQQRLQQKCRELAEEFATRSAGHDRDASHPIENYQRLRDEGFLALSVAREWGGSGASFLDHTIAYEALGRGCPSTALAFNMHASVVMPLLQSTEISAEIKQRSSPACGPRNTAPQTRPSVSLLIKHTAERDDHRLARANTAVSGAGAIP
jgi:alkylation response protein AidB-like acyl-CoA dehydrogenase